MYLLFSHQSNKRLCFCLFWWFLKFLSSLNYSLWNSLSLEKQGFFFLHRKNWWFFFLKKIPFLSNRIKYLSNCLPVSQHELVKMCYWEFYVTAEVLRDVQLHKVPIPQPSQPFSYGSYTTAQPAMYIRFLYLSPASHVHMVPISQPSQSFTYGSYTSDQPVIYRWFLYSQPKF